MMFDGPGIRMTADLLDDIKPFREPCMPSDKQWQGHDKPTDSPQDMQSHSRRHVPSVAVLRYDLPPEPRIRKDGKRQKDGSDLPMNVKGRDVFAQLNEPVPFIARWRRR